MTFKLVVLAFIASLSVVQISSCQTDDSEKRNEVREVFSVGSNVELLFFFKKESSEPERKVFFENILNQPHPGGGYWPRSGIKATFGIDRNGYEGFGFLFLEDASEQDKQDLKKVLKESPLIYKIYENVVPNEIKDLSDADIIQMDPDVRADIVYIFKKDITSDEINEFQRTVMGVPSKNSSGYSSLPGIMSEVMFYKADFRGEALRFKPNATDEEKALVKKRIKDSPLIFKIYENIVPDEINDLPKASEDKKIKSNGNSIAKPARRPVKDEINVKEDN